MVNSPTFKLIFDAVLTCLIRCANCNVDFVSSRYNPDAVAQQTNANFALPDRDGCRTRVNLESRYAIRLFDDAEGCPKADMTRDRVNKLKKISRKETRL